MSKLEGKLLTKKRGRAKVSRPENKISSTAMDLRLGRSSHSTNLFST